MTTKSEQTALKIKQLLEEKLATTKIFEYIINEKIPKVGKTIYMKHQEENEKEVIFLMTRNYTKEETEIINYLTKNKETYKNVAFIFEKGENYFRPANNGTKRISHARFMKQDKLEDLTEQEISKTLNLAYMERKIIEQNGFITYFNPEKNAFENVTMQPIVVPEFNLNIYNYTDQPIYSTKYYIPTETNELEAMKLINNALVPSKAKKRPGEPFSPVLKEKQPTLFD